MENHLLPEPKERVRELTEDEETRLFTALPSDYHPIVRFLLLSGCRLAECIGLRWSHIDWRGCSISILGKGDKKDTVPLTAGLRELLSPLQGNHPNVVFCYRAKRPRRVDGQLVRERGAWCPITYEGLKTAWRRKGVTIEDFRFHDTRHTAATRLLRSSRNLKLVQKLLRHEDIATTAKYAHVDDHDLMEAMERAENSRNYPRSRLRDAG